MSDKKALAVEIRVFIDRHAGIAADYDPDFDPPEERFSGPDAAMLEAAAIAFEEGRDIEFAVHSDWGSGSYRPYGDAEARRWHDDLVARVNAVRPHPEPRR
jgi:hypothetical protein